MNLGTLAGAVQKRAKRASMYECQRQNARALTRGRARAQAVTRTYCTAEPRRPPGAPSARASWRKGGDGEGGEVPRQRGGATRGRRLLPHMRHQLADCATHHPSRHPVMQYSLENELMTIALSLNSRAEERETGREGEAGSQRHAGPARVQG